MEEEEVIVAVATAIRHLVATRLSSGTATLDVTAGPDPCLELVSATSGAAALLVQCNAPTQVVFQIGPAGTPFEFVGRNRREIEKLAVEIVAALVAGEVREYVSPENAQRRVLEIKLGDDVHRILYNVGPFSGRGWRSWPTLEYVPYEN